ncbi:MAG: hypothetical protein HN981_04455 [Candidatus Pacebacteria bacterium]|jgi:hypothetical protein|nr:hypothetical protein [Candidatus Paceibacterota bacterium]MBT4652498.1 hypothetical protein [Candidatus Paceibacterota bacterium]MBT6756325.1 hypothetical protein [Candidatus Paceibacterota bacterium]MBT6921616.1 hypothetical protein [Candidatus Paceibacterota bacterium]
MEIAHKNEKLTKGKLEAFYREFKASQEHKKNEEAKSIWTNKILDFLKNKTVDNKIEVTIENEGSSVIYRFGELSVRLKIKFYNLSVGSQGGGSFYITMSKKDFEENSWFREAYEANKVALNLE